MVYKGNIGPLRYKNCFEVILNENLINSVSSKFTVSNGVRQGGILSPFLFNIYMDDLSVKLTKCPTGCIAGGTIVNHLMYADDIVLLSPSATGLSLLLHVCGKYGLEHDIRFNSKKSAVLIFRNSFVKDFSYPSFVMNGESIRGAVCEISWSCYKC